MERSISIPFFNFILGIAPSLHCLTDFDDIRHMTCFRASSCAGAIRHGGARALPLLELAGHGGAQIEQERLAGWAPSLCHKILHCILQVYADMHLTHFTLLEVYLLN